MDSLRQSSTSQEAQDISVGAWIAIHHFMKVIFIKVSL